VLVRHHRRGLADGRVCALIMFGSDNQAPAHPKVIDAITRANEGRMGSYGDDAWTARANALIAQAFETDDLDVYFVATGGAANGLALSALCPPWGAVLTHAQSHLLHDEGNGPEFFTAGARVIGLGQDDAKLTPAALTAAATRYAKANVHGLQPQVVSIANLSESGLVYSHDETLALSQICKAHDWFFHVDGARFGNAAVGAGARPADLSWRAGVDALSFGLTKTGGLACEAVILFGQARQTSLAYLRKRAGQLVSKHRLFGAQFVAIMEDDLWLRLASHANAMARALGEVFTHAGATLFHPIQGNEVFVRLTHSQSAVLTQAGIGHYPWAISGQADVYRFVTCWQTTQGDIDAVFVALTG
jgi:threonine aldolase